MSKRGNANEDDENDEWNKRLKILNQGQGGGNGLVNLGNTCYMNSILQCLARIPKLVSYFQRRYFDDLSKEAGKERKVDLIHAFSNVMNSMLNPPWEPARCANFKSLLGVNCPTFNNSSQQDAHQFLVQLFGVMNTVLHRKVPEVDVNQGQALSPEEKAWHLHLTRFNSFITELFCGQQKSTLRCTKCSEKRDSYSSFLTLSLPLPDVDCYLEDCFNKFRQSSQVSGWNCPGECKCPVEARSGYEITRLPSVFVIHLQRFQFSGAGWKKRETRVDFPSSAVRLHQIARPGCTSSAMYDLYATCNHTGSLQFGHYFAYGRASVNQPWFEYNDSKVIKFSEDYPNRAKDSAYVLFYVAREMNKATVCEETTSTLMRNQPSKKIQLSDYHKGTIPEVHQPSVLSPRNVQRLQTCLHFPENSRSLDQEEEQTKFSEGPNVSEPASVSIPHMPVLENQLHMVEESPVNPQARSRQDQQLPATRMQNQDLENAVISTNQHMAPGAIIYTVVNERPTSIGTAGNLGNLSGMTVPSSAVPQHGQRPGNVPRSAQQVSTENEKMNLPIKDGLNYRTYGIGNTPRPRIAAGNEQERQPRPSQTNDRDTNDCFPCCTIQ